MGKFRSNLLKAIKQVQQIDDAHLRTLPFSSKFLVAPALSALATLTAVRTSTKEWCYRQGILFCDPDTEPAAHGYPAVVYRRNWPICYIFHCRNGIWSQASLPAPVISVANLTNASGKTPLVQYLARHYLATHNIASLILQLGGGTVDETLMLRHAFEDTPTQITNSSSTTEIRDILRENPMIGLVLLDDGSSLGGQHLPLMRDLNVVTINALSAFGNGHIKPRGTLRERPRPALRRSDCVVLHHVDIASPEKLESANRLISYHKPRHALMMKTQMTPVSLRSLVPPIGARSLDMSEASALELGDQVALSKLNGAAVVCLTGVGMPSTVEAHLRQLGATHVEGCGLYEDHHTFSLEEIQEAVSRVRQLSLDPSFSHACIVITEKDYARQSDLFASVFSQLAPELCPQELADRPWGAYVYHSELSVVEHDKRFSTQSAALSTLLRLAIDNCRRRTYIT